ncbi:MAG: wax ester/triacylglycerol synthase family O-acyltransferase [Tepidiformaceae bacterium]
MAAPLLRQRMTATDASFLYFEKPSQPLHIGSMMALDGPLSRADLLAHMEARIHRLPRYRQLAAFDPLNLGHPRWEEDPAFDLGRHLEEATLPPKAAGAAARAALASILTPVLPRDRPLWRMTLLHGLPGGRSGVATAVHHCMVDGVSGIELLTVITDLERDAARDEPRPFAPAPAAPPLERARDAFLDMVDLGLAAYSDAIRRAFDPDRQMREFRAVSSAIASAAPSLLSPAPATPFNRPVGRGRSYGLIPMPFTEIRGIRSALGGTINDVVLTTLSGGLGAYLRARGQRIEGVVLRAMVPVNVRSESDKSALGNQVSMLIAPLPIGIADPASRHRQVIAGMGKLKEANMAGGFSIMSRLADQVPPMLQAAAGAFTPDAQPLFNLVCTNVPGPQIPLYLCGRTVEEVWPWVPLSMGLGLNVCLTSYNGVLFWGICADPALVPDIDEVTMHLSEAFEALKSAASPPAPTNERRLRGNRR